MLKKYHLKDYSFLLFLLVIIAMGIGVTVINSVNDNYTVKQAVGVGVSVLIMLILSLIDYHFITKFTLPLYITFSDILSFQTFLLIPPFLALLNSISQGVFS